VDYLPRLVDGLLGDLLDGVPAVLMVGPRACGKTTTARLVTRAELRLDRAGDADLVRADPDTALRVRPTPLLLDEWQLVPEVLGAVKRAVDDEPGNGRFVITGSSRTDLTGAGWPLTGRAVRVAMWGLCERELGGDPTAASVLERLARDGVGTLPRVADPPDLISYVERALRGGLPEVALATAPALRRRRLSGYVDEVVARDNPGADAIRDPIRLRRYLQAWAANLSCVVEHATLYEAAGINRLTAVAYDSLLASLFVVDPLPAWTSNRVARLAGRPKRHLVDPALVGPLLGVDLTGVLRDPVLLGGLLESFTLAQLRPELTLLDAAPQLFHVRDRDGRHEIDILLEYPDGRCVAIEVKAATTATASDARHLSWLRELLGKRFIGGLVLHTGPHTFPLAPDIVAAPIATLWS
jgi:predicted AAA+ superfamily ATPase